MISERQHQQALLELAMLRGWEWYHNPDSRRCTPGHPDLLLLRPPRLVFAELKTEKGRLTKEQKRWLEMLRECDTVEAYLWRPSDWSEIEEVLV